MMSAINRSWGVDPHLNGVLQTQPAWWESFQADHITHIREALDSVLPPEYYAASEKSLQISRIDWEDERHARTRPDIGIYRQQSATPSQMASSADAPTLVLPLTDTEPTLDDLPMAVVIYATGADGDQPITRIELLSPANKPPASGAAAYRARRRETLRADIALVEIDYLHHTPPVQAILPAYCEGEMGAFPYWVVVSRPHTAETLLFGIAVDAALPVLPVPLAGAASCPFDLHGVYARTLASSRAFIRFAAQPGDPPDIVSYTPDDQRMIRSRRLQQHGQQNEGD